MADLREIATRFLKHCENGEGEAAQALVNPDFRFEAMKKSVPEGQVLAGPIDAAGFFPFVKNARALTQDGMNLTVSLSIVEGDDVALFGDSDAITMSGEPYSNSYCWRFRFRDGKISLFNEYCDWFHTYQTIRK